MIIKNAIELNAPGAPERVTITLDAAEARNLLFAARRFQQAAVPLVGFTKQESDVMREIGRRLWALNAPPGVFFHRRGDATRGKENDSES